MHKNLKNLVNKNKSREKEVLKMSLINDEDYKELMEELRDHEGDPDKLEE